MTRPSSKEKLGRTLAPIKFIILLAILVSAISITLFYTLDDQTHFELRLTKDFLPGIITAIFIHKDTAHLWSNIAGITAGTFLAWAATHMSLLPRLRSRLFISTTMIMAIVTNILWVAIIISLDRTSGTSGASGLVYALWGSGVAFFVTNTTDALTLYRANERPKKKIKIPLLTNAVMTATFIVFIVLFRDQFLGVADGVNTFAHAIGFVGAFVMTMAGEIFVSRKYSYPRPDQNSG